MYAEPKKYRTVSPVKRLKPSAPPRKANKHAGLTIQEVADFPFLVAMATTHFPELHRERSVQSRVI